MQRNTDANPCPAAPPLILTWSLVERKKYEGMVFQPTAVALVPNVASDAAFCTTASTRALASGTPGVVNVCAGV